MSFYNHPFEFSKHNVFRAAHLSYTMPKYWESNTQQFARLSKYRKPTGTPSGNGLAIRTLQRKIAGMKPEIQLKAGSQGITPVAGYSQHQFKFCDQLATDAARGDKVLGDSWINKYLSWHIRADGTGASTNGAVIRVLVYRPLKAGASISFTTTSAIVDPSLIKVYDDVTFTMGSGGDKAVQRNRKVKLYDTQSTYVGTSPEKADIRLVVLCHNYDALLANQFVVNYGHFFTNK